MINTARNVEFAVERQLKAINALPGAFRREVFGTFKPPEPDELPALDDEDQDFEDDYDEEN